MELSSRFFVLIISLLLSLFVSESVFAFESIVIFGDSYSDDGNGVYNISEGAFPPSPPYFEGRFSNGPVWVEYLTKKLGLKSINYATGGATTNSLLVPSASGFNDEIVVPGIRQQVNEFVDYAHANAIGSKNSPILYLVTTFGDDYIYSIKHGLEMVSPEQVIGQLITNLQTLYIELGAINFLVTTLPNLANYPGFSKSNESEKVFLSSLVEDHNIILKQALAVLKSEFGKVSPFIIDIDEFFKGFTTENVVDSCLSINHDGTHVCDHPEDFLFWDNLHMTTSAHERLASEAYKLLA